jgi:hypothetical protein
MPFTKESASEHGSKGIKNKTLSAATRKRYERAAAAAEKEAVAAEAEEERAKEFGSNDEQDAASQEAFWARARAMEARARLGEGGTEEATAAEARRASGRHARQARTDGSVAEVKPSSADLAACAVARPVPTVMEVALQEMRARKSGWVCALRVDGRLHVYLAGDLENDRRWIKKVVTGGEVMQDGSTGGPLSPTRPAVPPRARSPEATTPNPHALKISRDGDGEPAALDGAFNAAE